MKRVGFSASERKTIAAAGGKGTANVHHRPNGRVSARTEESTAVREAHRNANIFEGVIITMDGDLQHDPAEIPAFIEKLNAVSISSVAGAGEGRILGSLTLSPSNL